MATTVHEPPKIDLQRLPSQGSGGGGWELWFLLAEICGASKTLPAPASTGIWVGLAAITMTFAAFTSALVVRQGGSSDWQHFTLPSILYFNSLIIIASSVTLETARRQITTFMVARNEGVAPTRWLYVTLALGLIFVTGQVFAWLQLKSQGFGLATNISYSFFYVLTVAHAIHLLGGLGGLVRVMSKVNHSVLRRSTLKATSLYWHFMGALWLYLLLLLWIKL